jgi:hypothetical protein
MRLGRRNQLKRNVGFRRVVVVLDWEIADGPYYCSNSKADVPRPIDDHVAKIDADPQLETALRRQRVVEPARGPLHLDGAQRRPTSC